MKQFLMLGTVLAGALMAQPAASDVIVFHAQVPAPGMGPMMHMKTMGTAVKGAPFQAETITESVQSLPDGNRITHRQSGRQYRDGEGRTRIEQEMRGMGQFVAQGEVPLMIAIDDPVAKTHIMLNPKGKIATKMGMPDGAKGGGMMIMRHDAPHPAGAAMGSGKLEVIVEEQKIVTKDKKKEGAAAGKDVMMWQHAGGGLQVMSGAYQPEVRKESLGKQVMEGLEVEGARETTVIPAGAIGNERPIEMTTERWYSPALQLEILRKHQDPRSGETTYRMTAIRRGEPDKSLFQIPADFKTEEPMKDMKIRKKVVEKEI